MQRLIHLTLNGRPVSVDTDDEKPLLWVLRTELALTGTKYGCGAGVCAACTASVPGQATRSCITPVKAVADRSVLTIEGLAADGHLRPLQQAFIDHGAFQCGYCTPGMLLAAHQLLAQRPRPSAAEVTAHLEPHLCRCGAHQRVVAAVLSVAGHAEPAT